MRILFITATRIGDAVLSTGVLDQLLTRHPGARVTVACGAPAAPLFESVPGLEALLVVRKQSYNMHWLKLWSQVGRTRWDLVVDLRASVLSFFVPAKRRQVVGARTHDLHRVTELQLALGLAEPPAPRLWLAAQDEAAAQRLVPDGPPVLALGATANWLPKCWPPERFAALAEKLTSPRGLLPGARIAVCGGPSEREQVAPLLEALGPDRLIDLVGVGLRDGAACLARAALFVGNDSGLMHTSAAVGTPTLGLFGPSPEQRYGPWGTHCAYVRTPESYAELTGGPDFSVDTRDCLMASLTVEAVVEAAESLWQRVGAPSGELRAGDLRAGAGE